MQSLTKKSGAYNGSSWRYAEIPDKRANTYSEIKKRRTNSHGADSKRRLEPNEISEPSASGK